MYTTLHRSADLAGRPIHRADEIDIFEIDPALVQSLETHIDKHTTLDLTRTEGRLYVMLRGHTFEGDAKRLSLSAL